MPLLKNALLKKMPVGVDERIDPKIKLYATTEIDERIGKLFCFASMKLSDQLEYEKMKDVPTCCCVFTDGEEITFTLKENQFGAHLHFCWYPVEKWLKNDYSNTEIIKCILEEFCHFYWNIEDEVEVCYKVLEIMKRIDDRLKLEDLYDDNNIEYRKQIKE
ncbi:MAG: hypothetical protein ABF633_01655 [Clostridium sp.]|uniref:hypothetical protein n=1 Tax=Clostridium sp. TaxID=1506 RepID=UPI0039E9C8AF